MMKKPGAKECGWPLKAGKGKMWILPYEQPPERNTMAETLTFSTVRVSALLASRRSNNKSVLF